MSVIYEKENKDSLTSKVNGLSNDAQIKDNLIMVRE
jgi:hypothetical protein